MLVEFRFPIILQLKKSKRKKKGDLVGKKFFFLGKKVWFVFDFWSYWTFNSNSQHELYCDCLEKCNYFIT